MKETSFTQIMQRYCVHIGDNMGLTKKEINEFLKEKESEFNGINYIRLITENRSDKKYSFNIDYNCIKTFYYVKNGEVVSSNDENDYYYGLSPKFTTIDRVNEIIKSDILLDSSNLNMYFNGIEHYFMLDKEDIAKKYGEALRLKCIVKYLSHYGFGFEASQEVKKYLSKVSGYYILVEDKVYFKGRPTDPFLDKIGLKFNVENENLILDFNGDNDLKSLYDKSKFIKCKYDNENVATLLDSNEIIKLFFEDSDFDKLEEDSSIIVNKLREKNIDLSLLDKKQLLCFNNSGTRMLLYQKNNILVSIVGDNTEYYSGVLPRLRKIVNSQKPFNSKVESYEINISRTTYATVDALCDNKILNMDIFDQCSVNTIDENNQKCKRSAKEVLKDFNDYEFELENKLFDKEIVSLDDVNEYMQSTNGPLNIAVSSNIFTKDKYLLFGFRSASSIDNGTLYCSINGQSEIADTNVEFYKDSVYDDFPTIDLKNNRLDFNHELARETLAELSLPGYEDDFKYLGISMLGQKRSKSDENPRFHFNILATHNSSYSFEEVQNRWRESTEEFENKEILGYKLKVFKSKRKYLFESLKSIMSFIKEKKDKIIMALSMITAVFMLLFLPYEYSKLEFENIFDYIINWNRDDVIGIISNCISIAISVYGLFLLGYGIYNNYNVHKRCCKTKYFYLNEKKNYDYCRTQYTFINKQFKKKLSKLMKDEKNRDFKSKLCNKNIMSPIAVVMLLLGLDELTK